MHGHRYHIRLEIMGEINEIGWIIDYAEIKEIADPVIMALDHHTLNDIEGLENPTCENIVEYLRKNLCELWFSAIELRETDRAGAGWRR